MPQSEPTETRPAGATTPSRSSLFALVAIIAFLVAAFGAGGCDRPLAVGVLLAAASCVVAVATAAAVATRWRRSLQKTGAPRADVVAASFASGIAGVVVGLFTLLVIVVIGGTTCGA